MEEGVAIDQVIQKNFTQLQQPGVLFVRPGYEATKDRVKDEPAMVVTVADKRGSIHPRSCAGEDWAVSDRGQPDAYASCLKP